MCDPSTARTSRAPVRHHRTMPAPRKRVSQADVLSQLPSKRPQRASARRTRPAAERPLATDPTAKVSPQQPAATRKASPAKPAGTPTPRAVRPSAATNRTREPGPRVGSPRRPAARPKPPPTRPGVDMIETAMQAAGELTQIGVTFGIRALRGAISRLPRP